MTRRVILGAAAVRLAAAGEVLLQGPRTHVADRLEFLPGPVAGLDELFDVCHVDCPAP